MSEGAGAGFFTSDGGVVDDTGCLASLTGVPLVCGCLGVGGGGSSGSGGGRGIVFARSSLSRISSATISDSALSRSSSMRFSPAILCCSCSREWSSKTRIAALRTRSCSNCAAAKALWRLDSEFRSSKRKLEECRRLGLDCKRFRPAGEERDMMGCWDENVSSLHQAGRQTRG